MNPYDNLNDFMKMTGMTHAMMGIPTTSGCVTLDITPTCPQPAEKCGYGNKPKEDKIPMASYASAVVSAPESIEQTQRHAVMRALSNAFDKIRSDLKKQFGLIDDESPKTPTELVKRIADGQYTIDKEHADYEGWDAASAVRYVRWRDPSKVEDKAGYKAARAQLDTTYEDTKLKAVLSPVADLLQLVEDFKAWKTA